jgi:hypothetical protein
MGVLGAQASLVAILSFQEGLSLWDSLAASIVWIGVSLAVLVVAMAFGAAPLAPVKAGKRPDSAGKPRNYTLTYKEETIDLEPGRPWSYADRFKWVTRGIIETPQSYHVLPDGTVDVNDEKIRLNDPDGEAKLEREVNKRHAGPEAAQTAAAAVGTPRKAAAARRLARDKVLFRVHLDHLKHFQIECRRGEEQTVTGVRGIHGLVENGLMVRPRSVHLDPLQRYFELDGVRFDSTEEGAQRLEEALNANYAPSLHGQQEAVIEVRDNPASATGFDIYFPALRAGARVLVKEHLSQASLDILQDQDHCEMLQRGILVRLSPPYLLVRRKRSDGGEEHVPEIADTHYRRVTAAQLQQVLNHPLIRRSSGGPAATVTAAAQGPPEIVKLRVVKNPQNPLTLWLECVKSKGAPPEGKAFTHHNVADLQQARIFLPHLDVALSLDGRTLSIVDREGRPEQRITVDTHSSEEDLRQASRILTGALKPPSAPAAAPSPETPLAAAGGLPESAKCPTAAAPAEALPSVPPAAAPPSDKPPLAETVEAVAALTRPPEKEAETRVATPPPMESKEPGTSATAAEMSKATSPPAAGETDGAAAPPLPKQPKLFREGDPVQVIKQVFWRLCARAGLPAQDVWLSLPPIFTDRRFEVLGFSHPQVTGLTELRGEEFYGFYLSHISPEKAVLVYACQGKQLEFGPKRCLLHTAPTAEPSEYQGSALLGLGQDASGSFVFVVTPEFKAWIAPHQKLCHEAYAEFITAGEFFAGQDKYVLIWPESAPAAEAGEA